MKQLFFTLLTLAALCPACAGATGDSLYFLLPSDTVTLYSDRASGHLLFDHYLAPKQTLFGVTKFYGLSLDEVYHLNPRLRGGYEVGDKVRVVIPQTALRPSFSPDSIAWFVPVSYQMTKGETLFGLTRRTLGHPNDSIIRMLNPTVDPERLQPGQILRVGFLKLDGIPPEMQAEVEDPYVIRNRGMRELWNTRTQGKRMKSTNGKAAWTTKGDRNKWMVLHRTAPINSLIELEDPRSKKTLYARVVGRIPEKAYDSRVVAVVSPLLVKAFGVRDKEFYVRTRHF